MTFTDIQAEYAVLAALMVWPQSYDRVGDLLTADDFSAPENGQLWDAIKARISVCRDADPVSVAHEVKRLGGSLTLADINAIAGGASSQGGVRRHAEIVRELSLARALVKATIEAQEIAMEGEEGALERVVALFSDMAHRSVKRMPVPLSDLLMGRIDHYTALSQGDTPIAMPTGIPALDRMLTGGLRGGKVYVLAARPSVGKTSLSAQIAQRRAKDGDPVLFLTQEMPNDEVVDRAVSHEGRIDYGRVMTGKFDNDDWGRMCESVETLSRVPFYVDDQGGLTLHDIRTKARSVKGLRCLVIDYLQLCSGSGKSGANRNTEIEEISRGIKALAKELDIAVLLLSQLNRKVEERQDKEPTLADLRDSGSIEQDADAVIFLWPVRDLSHDGAHKLVGCAIAKNRSGQRGRFGLDFQGAHQRWHESMEDVSYRPAQAERRAPARRAHFTGDDE